MFVCARWLARANGLHMSRMSGDYRYRASGERQPFVFVARKKRHMPSKSFDYQ